MTAEDSWRDLVERHGATLIRVAYRVLGNIHDAEDVAQCVLLEVFAKETWPDVGILKRLAAFRAIDYLRTRETLSSLDESMNYDASVNPEGRVEVEEQADQLRAAIGRLPPRQAQCFWLRYIEGLSSREIADSQSMSESAVSTAIYKARLALQARVLREQQGSNE